MDTQQQIALYKRLDQIEGSIKVLETDLTEQKEALRPVLDKLQAFIGINTTMHTVMTEEVVQVLERLDRLERLNKLKKVEV